MSTLENFFQLIGAYPWEAVWTVLGILFVLAILARTHLGGFALAIIVLAVVLIAAPWKKSTAAPAPVQAPVEQVEPQAEPVEPQAPESRPSPYGEPPETTPDANYSPAAVL